MGRLVAAAVLAGAMLAVGNARTDLERDKAAGTRSVATALGLRRSWTLALGILLAVVVIALPPLVDATTRGSAPWSATAAALAGVGLLLAGAGIGYRASPSRRERAWEVQAIGIAVLAVGWLGVVSAQP